MNGNFRPPLISSKATEAPGFSLVELLVVILMLGLLAALLIPGLNSVASAGRLTHDGEMIVDQLVLARQMSTTKNRDVEVRFVTLPELGGSRRFGVQLWIDDNAGGGKSPMEKMRILSLGVVVDESSDLSPLLFGNPPLSGRTNFPPHGECDFRGFRYLASATTDIPATGSASASNYFTVKNQTDQENPPANFFVIQVNPINGKVDVFRP